MVKSGEEGRISIFGKSGTTADWKPKRKGRSLTSHRPKPTDRATNAETTRAGAIKPRPSLFQHSPYFDDVTSLCAYDIY